MEDNQDQQNQNRGVGIPLSIWTHHFNQLNMELRSNNIISNVRKFDGEGHESFRQWVADLERAKLIIGADDAKMRQIALHTTQGSAADFILRKQKDDPRIQWANLLSALKERYSDLSDSQYAKQRLHKLKQLQFESVQNFGERILSLAQEAYPNTNMQDEMLQSTLVGVFMDGVQNDFLARKLIKTRPRTLEAAIKVATDEQMADRQFLLRRSDRVEEDMEVDLLNSDQSNASKNTLTEKINSLAEDLAKLTKIVTSQKRASKKAQNQTHKWTEDNRPICSNCKKPGHYQKNCNSKN